MQQDPNLQARFNQDQQNYQLAQYNQNGGYPSLPPQDGYPQQGATYPQFNQYSGYQQNPPQAGYPTNPVYNAQIYQQPYLVQPQFQAQVVLTEDQRQAMTAQSAAQGIETRIITGFCCYTCLVYFELIMSLCTLVYGIFIEVDLEIGGLIALNAVTGLTMFIACVLAITAKANFDRSKQNGAFGMFIIATILAVTSSVIIYVNLNNLDYYDGYPWCDDYPYDYDDTDYSDCDDLSNSIAQATADALKIVVIVTIVFQLLIGFGLICSAYNLSQLMKKRNEYLEEARRKNGIGAVVITA